MPVGQPAQAFDVLAIPLPPCSFSGRPRFFLQLHHLSRGTADPPSCPAAKPMRLPAHTHTHTHYNQGREHQSQGPRTTCLRCSRVHHPQPTPTPNQSREHTNPKPPGRIFACLTPKHAQHPTAPTRLRRPRPLHRARLAAQLLQQPGQHVAKVLLPHARHQGAQSLGSGGAHLRQRVHQGGLQQEGTRSCLFRFDCKFRVGVLAHISGSRSTRPDCSRK